MCDSFSDVISLVVRLSDADAQAENDGEFESCSLNSLEGHALFLLQSRLPSGAAVLDNDARNWEQSIAFPYYYVVPKHQKFCPAHRTLIFGVALKHQKNSCSRGRGNSQRSYQFLEAAMMKSRAMVQTFFVSWIDFNFKRDR